MIDDAEAANSKKRNDQIGFRERDDDAGADDIDNPENRTNRLGPTGPPKKPLAANRDIFGAARQAANDSNSDEDGDFGHAGAGGPDEEEKDESSRPQLRMKQGVDPLSAS